MELSKIAGRTEPGQNCALNQTRECFLGLHVVAGDFSLASLTDWMATLRPNSSTGIWMVPFRGILTTDVPVPLDLLYLDEECRVLDAVEFFPTFRVSPSSPTAASVLALPSHSIFSSQTQRGDRLVVCPAEEMEWRLEQIEQSGQLEQSSHFDQFTNTGTMSADPHSALPSFVQGPVLVRDEPKKVVVPFPVREEIHDDVRPTPVCEEPGGAAGMGVIAPIVLEPAQPPAQPVPSALPLSVPETPVKPGKATRNWLQRWLSPEPAEPRKSPRDPVAGLTAHFFTGGAPVAHVIRDFSATGLYVVTTERWYPGTVIRMTLSKPDIGQAPSERSITIEVRSVRWGNDGVGVEFVIAPARKSGRGKPSPLDPVDSAQLARFLKPLKKSNR
jgi:hypothetical protein